MILDDDQIRALVARPGEALNVEIKRWINPSQPGGVAKIVKAAFALRNRNGGFLVIGVDGRTLQPDAGNAPADIRAAFHQDVIQGLVSRYANEPFEVHVAFVEHEGAPSLSLPFLQVCGCLSPLKTLCPRARATSCWWSGMSIFVRCMPTERRARPLLDRMIGATSSIYASTIARRISGGFWRRQLAGQDASRLVAAFQGDALPGDALRTRCAALLQQGQERFMGAQKDRGLSIVEQALLDRLSWEIALAIDPPRAGALPDKEFLATFAGSNPKYTGWPVWLDARAMADERSRPVVRGGAWEALIVARSDDTSNRLEFSRLDPKKVNST